MEIGGRRNGALLEDENEISVSSAQEPVELIATGCVMVSSMDPLLKKKKDLLNGYRKSLEAFIYSPSNSFCWRQLGL